MANHTQVLRPRELSAMLHIHRSTLLRWRRNGILPPPIHLGARSIGWLRETIDQWLASRPPVA